MGRKFVAGLVVVLLFAAAGTAFALLSDDDTTDTTQGTTTTVATSASTPSSSTSAPTTTAPPSTATSAAAVEGCGADGGAIAAAVNAGVTGASDNAQVDQCRLAAVDPSWAGVRLVARPGADFASVTVVLRGKGGSWSIVGSGDAACAATPQQVLVDLGLLCSTSGGGGL